MGSLLLCRSAFLYFGPTLLLNLTPSIPKGVYLVDPSNSLKKGEIVVFRPPMAVYRALGKRPWLNEEKFFIKPIAAVSGDEVCKLENSVVINQTTELSVLRTDSQGKLLPKFDGCKTIGAHEFLPISTYSSRSFDGRYFGPIPTSAILGKAIPVFTW